MSFCLLEYSKIDVGCSQICSPPDLLSGFKGAASQRGEWRGRDGRTRGRGKRGREGRGNGEWGREGNGEVGGIAPWLLGG